MAIFIKPEDKIEYIDTTNKYRIWLTEDAYQGDGDQSLQVKADYFVYDASGNLELFRGNKRVFLVHSDWLTRFCQVKE